MQILKKLYQVGGDLNGITWDGVDAGYNDSNCYIIERPEGLIMIDCGCGDTLEQIFDNLKYWDLNPDHIKYCFLTHPHLDHAGAGHLLKKSGVKFVSSAETADAVKKGDERCGIYLYHKTFTQFVVDHILDDGEKIKIFGIEFEANLLPGHSMGCTAYLFKYGNKRIVVSGDIIGTLLDGYFGWNGSIDFDRKIYLESLKRFAKVEADIMLPGHGLIYFHKPQRRIEEALNMALMEWR
jgi:glyoxylase-like metal-dependent hydrolase (beta-lactamase superfamily II)